MTQHCSACGSAVPAAAQICGRCAHTIERPPAASARLNEQPSAGSEAQPSAGSAEHGPTQAQTKPQPAWIKKLGPFGAIAVAALKFKTAIFLLLTKAKFLLFGLSQLKTLLSMFAFFGVYWALYGWKFAAGFVIGIYIHEMGHVWMLRHYGLRASAPMFIPGFGAFVSLYDSPADVNEDARIGLAGPLWGAGAAITALLLAGAYPQQPVWLAVARATAYINLFNLIPVWSLDGGRGFRALDLRQRWMWIGLVALLWYLTRSGLFVLLLVGALYRVFWKKDPAARPDMGAFLEFAALLALFGALLAWLPLLGSGGF
jgi:Zn-dependent protease